MTYSIAKYTLFQPNKKTTLGSEIVHKLIYGEEKIDKRPANKNDLSVHAAAELFPPREEAEKNTRAYSEKYGGLHGSSAEDLFSENMEAYDWLVRQDKNMDKMKRLISKYDTNYSLIQWAYQNPEPVIF